MRETGRFPKSLKRKRFAVFFVAKNVLWKNATYITNIGHTSEMKGFLNEALFGVFKTNLTRYMSSLFNEKLFKSLIESLQVSLGRKPFE